MEKYRKTSDGGGVSKRMEMEIICDLGLSFSRCTYWCRVHRIYHHDNAMLVLSIARRLIRINWIKKRNVIIVRMFEWLQHLSMQRESFSSVRLDSRREKIDVQQFELHQTFPS